MRGKVWVSVSFGFTTRITPAYAGKSRIVFQTLGLFEDHPRLCGEKFKLVAIESSTGGSPPPMRGKVTAGTGFVLVCGITPAYAGKSGDVGSWSPSGGDHPRLCGEKLKTNAQPKTKRGSPPPMRGKAARTLIHNDIIGITPAYAGKRNFV